MDSGEAMRARQLYEAGKARFADDFDPERGLVRVVTEDRVYHPTSDARIGEVCALPAARWRG